MYCKPVSPSSVAGVSTVIWVTLLTTPPNPLEGVIDRSSTGTVTLVKPAGVGAVMLVEFKKVAFLKVWFPKMQNSEEARWLRKECHSCKKKECQYILENKRYTTINMLFLAKQEPEGLAEYAEFITCHFSSWWQEKYQKLNLKNYFIWLAEKSNKTPLGHTLGHPCLTRPGTWGFFVSD